MKKNVYRQTTIAMAVFFGLIFFSQTARLIGQDTPKAKVTRNNPVPSANTKTVSTNSNMPAAGNDPLGPAKKKEKNDNDKDMILGSKSFGIDRFGQNGETLDSAEVHFVEIGQVEASRTSAFGQTQLTGQTRVGEARARTYSDKMDLKNGDSSAVIGAEAQANLIRSEYGVANTSRTRSLGGVEIQQQQEASVEAFVGGHAKSEASVNLTSDPEVSARASVFAGAKVDANASNTTTVLGASSTQSASGYAAAGAGADAGIGLDKKGISADAGAFAGAKAGANGSVEVAGVEGGGNAEAWAGVGARAKADAGYDAGKLRVSLGAGAAVGVGGSVDTELTIDVAKTAHDVKQIDRHTGRMIETSANRAKESFNSAGGKIESNFRKSPFNPTRQSQTILNGQLSKNLPTKIMSSGRIDRGFARPGWNPPAVNVPKIKNSIVKKPAIKKPSFKKPAIKKPSIRKPAFKKPNIRKPAIKKPSIKKPSVKKPSFKKPKIKSPFKKKR